MYGRIPAVHPAPKIDSKSHLLRQLPQAFRLAWWLCDPPTSATLPYLRIRGFVPASRGNLQELQRYKSLDAHENVHTASPICPDRGRAAASATLSAQS